MTKIYITIFVACAVALGAVSASAQPSGDPFVCYKARSLGSRGGLPSFTAREGDVVLDTFSTARPEDRHKVDLAKSLGLCTPASVEGELILDPAVHLEAYDVRVTKTAPRQPRHADSVHHVVNRFGQLKLRVETEDRLLTPTLKAIGTGGVDALATSGLDSFKCYDAKVARAPRGAPAYPEFVPQQVMVEDQFGPRVYKVTKPRRFCAPADLAGASPAAPTHPTYLVCYQLRVASTKPKQSKFVATQVSTHPVFGAEALNVTKPDEICVPSFRDPASATPVPTATATPAPSGNVVAIRISPKTRYVTPGGTATFTATAELVGGGTENYTQKVIWNSSNMVVALAANATNDRSRISAVAQGTATISAVDGVTGISSADSAGSAVVTVLGALESITLSPVVKTRPAGQSQSYVATGHYAGGVMQNITQEVTYASSDPSVAAAPNTAGNKGKVDAIVPGVATISASHPSGVTTTTGGNDATLTVSAAVTNLLSISLSPTSATRAVGELQNFTATGHYEGGGIANLTQQVVYVSSDPSVVSAPNTAGNKSRVDMIAPGTATISATYTDPNTQLQVSTTDSGEDATITVLGALERITLSPLDATRAANQSITYTAIGHFGGGVTKNLTQRVDYHSSDPSVAAAPNTIGNKSRVNTLAPGEVTISATDPVTGVSTTTTGDDVILIVIGALERITLSPLTASRSPGSLQRYTATGHFGGGITQNLTQELIYSSSDSTVASASNDEGDRSRIDALAPGTVTISATHPTAGVSTSDTSDDAELTVE